jgi:hypothetical protein
MALPAPWSAVWVLGRVDGAMATRSLRNIGPRQLECAERSRRKTSIFSFITLVFGAGATRLTDMKMSSARKPSRPSMDSKPILRAAAHMAELRNASSGLVRLPDFPLAWVSPSSMAPVREGQPR